MKISIIIFATALLAASTVLADMAAPSPQPVRLVAPTSGSESSNPFPGFSWSEHLAAFKDMSKPVEYEIQISATTNFATPVDEDRVALNRYVHAQPFSPGTYYWRVRAIPCGESPLSWSESAKFTICDPEIVVTVDTAKDFVVSAREAVAKVRDTAGKSARIVVPAGDYPIDGSLKGPLFDVSGLSNVVIDGTGARLHFSNRKQGLIVGKGSANIVVIGFDSSFAKGALRVQGKVQSIDAANRRITVAVDPDYPGFDASDNLQQDIFYLLEPGTEGRLKTGGPNFFRADGGIKREADGVWSFAIPRDTGFCKVGDRFGYNFRSGSAHLVDFSESSHMTAYGLTNAGWGGMQFVSIEGSDFRILGCKSRFEAGEWMTGNADGVHIRGHALGPWIEGVRIHAIGDDSVALYARPAWMKSVETGPSNRVAICRSEFFNLEAGDEVSFFQPLEGKILLETRVEKVVPVDGGFKVTFADALPSGLCFNGPVQHATQIWNRSKSCGDFMVRNSEFINIRRYGTVFRAKRGVVENNLYRGISSRAVIFRNETEWPNGLYASEIIVRNNSITDSGFDSVEKQPVIAFLFSGYKHSAASIGPRNLLIEGNKFENCSSPEISLSWTRNAVVRNNRVKQQSGSMEPAKTQFSNSTQITTAPSL